MSHLFEDEVVKERPNLSTRCRLITLIHLDHYWLIRGDSERLADLVALNCEGLPVQFREGTGGLDSMGRHLSQWRRFLGA